MAKEWSLDKGARFRIDTALQAITDIQEGWPVCVVCGQKTRALDKFGCCSKTTEIHREHREGR